MSDTTFEAMYREIHNDFRRMVFDQLHQHSNKVDEDGDQSGPMIISEVMIDAGVTLMLAHMQDMPVDDQVQAALEMVARMASRTLNRIHDIEVTTECGGIHDTDRLEQLLRRSRQMQPSDHNAKLRAEILKEAKEKGEIH